MLAAHKRMMAMHTKGEYHQNDQRGNATRPLLTLLKPFAKPMARQLSKRCPQCNRERLLAAFDYYATNSPGSCPRCHITARLMKPVIHRFFENISLPEDSTKKLLSNSFLTKCMLNTIQGIAHFGLTQPQTTGVPVAIVWNFTNQCNLRCLHCHQDSHAHPTQGELTTPQALAVVDNMANAGVSILTFSGGEPLSRPDLYDVAHYATQKGLFCTLATNGTLLTPHTVQKLYTAGIKSVEIGLDGTTPQPHETLRNTPGCFIATIQGIKNCVALKKFHDISIATTLTKLNIHEIPQIINLCESLGATRFYLNRIIAAGRGQTVTHLDVTPQEKIQVLNHLFDRFKHAVVGKGILCYTRGMTYFSRLCYQRSGGSFFPVSEALSGYDKIFDETLREVIPEIVRNLAEEFGGCSAGVTYAGLSTTGDLLPCVPAPISLGNLLEEKLGDIWTQNPLLHQIRARGHLTGSCGNCTYQKICGGCRYTAYVGEGDWLGPDISCPFTGTQIK